jgi:UDPglucose 6-dehydrogenase
VTQRVKIYSNPYAACADASAIAIMTEWDLFKAEAPSFAAPKPLQVVKSGHAEGPLRAYTPPDMAGCAPGCEQCASTEDREYSVDLDERLDWARVAEGMKHPRYVLDGRGILEERAFKVLGLDLEGLGWGATSSAQYAW